MGNFTFSYDLFSISLVTKLIGRIYYHYPDTDPKPGILPPEVSAAVNGVALCGSLAGQTFSGWLRDKLGSKKVHAYGITIVVICSIASGFTFGNSAKSVMTSLCFFRFWQGFGFGIGGDYPLSATIMSRKRTRRTCIAAVCAMQGFGALAGGAVGCSLSAVFNHLYPAPAGSVVPEADFFWRIMLMLVAIPAAVTRYWRMKMWETARRDAVAADMSIALQVESQEDPEKEFGLFSMQFLKRHGVHLLSTATTWFLLDMAYYSQNLFQKDVFTAIGWIPHSETMNAIEEVFHISRAQTLIALCSTVPGYWLTVALIGMTGRLAIQIVGFFFMSVFMFALAIPYNYWTLEGNWIGFVVMYSLTLFFANLGPNATKVIAPADMFPARLISICHGISAAAGKAGAIVGAFGFLYAAQSHDPMKTDKGYPTGIGLKKTLLLLGGTNLLGLLLSTLLVPETKENNQRHVHVHEEEDGSMTIPIPMPMPISNIPTTPV